MMALMKVLIMGMDTISGFDNPLVLCLWINFQTANEVPAPRICFFNQDL
jgi:hypothetical protein